MKIISWNYRGMSHPLTVLTVQNLTQSHKPNLLFPMETKMEARKLEWLGLTMGFRFWSGVDNFGYGGGL